VENKILSYDLQLAIRRPIDQNRTASEIYDLPVIKEREMLSRMSVRRPRGTENSKPTRLQEPKQVIESQLRGWRDMLEDFAGYDEIVGLGFS
jgi:hypothetical protein